MRWLLQALAFALGTCLSIRAIAALYRILDLWYAIRTEYLRAARGILLWGLLILAIGWGLDPAYRTAFACGLRSFLCFYLSLYVLRHVLFAMQRRSMRVSRSRFASGGW